MCSYCGQRCRGRYDKQVCRVRDLSLAGWRIYLEYERWRVNCSGCGGVHVEHLDWLANNSRYTQRFATHVGKLWSSLNFPVKSPYGSPRSVKLLIPPTCLAGEARCEAPRLS